jgi:SpoVK/Ycf46/Vps4 family AAA+-type ATPase
MDDLHAGLLIKIFVTMSEADRRWSTREQHLGAALFEHLWGRKLSHDQLRKAAQHVSRRAQELSWYSLVRPFDQIAPLRERISELETIVMRLATIVAKANGERAGATTSHLMDIQNELKRHLRAIPIDEPGQHAAADAQGERAIGSIRSDARELREEWDLDAAPPPAVAKESSEERLADALAELDALIGMRAVKAEVHTLTNFLKIQKERKRAGLPQTILSLHMAFRGNPGTGKTTVARILGRIYGALGMLVQGHLVETDRSGLVAEYAGQTGPKTNRKIDEALDGVLFIDEAYSLSTDMSHDPYGGEAVQALVKRMEDDRNRLIVILAGYPEGIDALLASNPGLSSRFGRQIAFEDYTVSELAQIFGKLCAANHYELPPSARVKLLLGLKWLYDTRNRNFGNGRTVRNLFELAIRRLANRIAGVTNLTRKHLTVFAPEDIEFENTPAEVSSMWKTEGWQFEVVCPSCLQPARIPSSYLGRKVKCNGCRHRFVMEWGDPVSPA